MPNARISESASNALAEDCPWRSSQLFAGRAFCQPRVALLVHCRPPCVHLPSHPPAIAQTVTDGDSLVVQGERIRLFGIDAPELSQVCAGGWRAGEESKRALARIIGETLVDCQAITKD
jgi:endonuclease YncB( thermonuclease family)